MERGKRQGKIQDEAEDEYKSAEYEGLPSVESHIRSFIVAPNGQEEDRRGGSEVGECANRIVRETGFFSVGHDLSRSDLERPLVRGCGRWAGFFRSFHFKKERKPERANS